MPQNLSLEPVTLPMPLRFGEEPQTEFVNDLDAVDHGGDVIGVAVDGNTGMQPTPLQGQQPDIRTYSPLPGNLVFFMRI